MMKTAGARDRGFPISDVSGTMGDIDLNCSFLSDRAQEVTFVNTRKSHNRLKTAFSGGRTRVVESLAEPPVRFVQPKVDGDAALVFVSAFGGGMLEGDDYRFDLEAGEGSTLMFAPQANTRVFPCPDGAVTRQHTRGTVYARATAVSGGDPTVLYAGSRFHQTQTWTLHPGSRLALMDWFVAGRLERGESFAFDGFESEIRVEDPEGRPLLSDALRVSPGDGARAGMGGFASHLAAYVVGEGWETVHRGLDAFLRAAGEGERPAWMDASRIAGLGVREGVGCSLRALGADRAALEPLAGKLFELLSSREWLGFDYWKRKY
jgi:urease accessory protein